MGTTSHAGKSVLVTGFCRILRDMGVNVAPFKAQNMSLNSWVTENGGEIGIAQAIQARAARLEPTVDMNPVLLKPKGDRTSQVIVRGRPYADRQAGEYYDDISRMLEVVEEGLDNLYREFEAVVMEGAGGAAEINLYERDIVNLGTARLSKAPIIIVGDIERGGVFAQLYGTLELLPEDVKQQVKGFIINKFRGDPGILEPGLRQLEDLTGVPVLGVVPHAKLRIPSEDSVSINDKTDNEAGGPEVAVIRFPRISNFTDFEPLEAHARVRYVDPDEDLGDPDCIVLPGTKNTVADLKALREHGMDRQIIGLAENGTPVFGICGGYQMLGQEIIDMGYEDVAGVYEGLGLLPVRTCFEAYEKTTQQVKKTVTGDGPILGQIQGEEVCGYEIHMGATELGGQVAFQDDGCVSSSGLVIGTYLHGLFENENLRRALLTYLGVESVEEDDSDPYDELANLIRENVDMDRVLRIMGLPGGHDED